MDVRRSAWYAYMPEDVDRNAEEFGGMYNDRTFPRTNVWRGKGFVCVRRGVDTFAVRVFKGTNLTQGQTVELVRGNTKLTCRIDRVCTTTETDEVKSKNCGTMVMSLLGVN